jgi:23S rRNA (adenine2503-C2)-methyltransferase
MKKSAFALTSAEWSSLLTEKGRPSPTVMEFFLEGLYKNPKVWERHISKELLEELTQELDFELPEISKVLEAQDTTIKFQVRFKDGLEVETVLIPFHRRYTVCLSTQVGCAMNCGFCYTGTQGLKRHLHAGEIVGQYLVARRFLRAQDPKALNPRIVFMGQGEPLHNVDQVLQAIRIFNDKMMLALGPREMTLSTVGHLPGMKRLQEFPRINIALSLHSPFEDQRTKLIPINAKYPLAQVMEALDRLPMMEKRIVTYEYLLVKDFNMGVEHADGLQELLGNRRAVLNLIPFNPFPGSDWKRPECSEVDAFKEKLVARKLRALVRTTKGDEILAACGQLKIDRLSRKYGTTR